MTAKQHKNSKGCEKELPRLAALFENAADAVVVMDASLGIRHWNRAAESLFGWRADEVGGKRVPDLLRPAFPSGGMEAAMKRIFETGSIMNETFFYRRDGTPVRILVTATLLRDAGGNPMCIVAVLRDITPLKRAEEGFKLLLAVSRAVAEAPDFESALRVTLAEVCAATGWRYGEAWVPLPDGSALGYSPAWVNGDRPELKEFRASSGAFTFPPGKGLPGRVWASKRPEWLRDVSAERESVFFRAPHARDAGLRACLAVPVLAGEEVVAVLIFFMYEERDKDPMQVELVSGVAAQVGSLFRRKRAENALRESEERYRMLVEQAPDGIFLADDRGNYMDVNAHGCEMLGYAREEMLKLNIRDLIPPEDLASLPLRLDELREGKVIVSERRLRRRDGSLMETEISARMLPDGRLQGIVRDITPRRRTEAALWKLSRVVEQTADMVLITGRDGTIEYVNPAFEAVTGYSKEDVLGKTPRVLKSGAKDEEYYGRLWKTILTGGVFRDVFINRKRSGELYYEEKTVTPLRDAQGGITHFVATSKDITERMRTAAEMARLASFPELNPNPVIELDRRGAITYLNPAATRLLPGLPVTGADHPLLAGVDRLCPETAGEPCPPATREVELNGTWYEEFIGCIEGVKRVRLYIYDITARKREEGARLSLARANARAELFGFIASAFPLFASGVPPQLRDMMAGSFADKFERNLLPDYERETARAVPGTGSATDAVLDGYLSWFTDMVSGLGIRAGAERSGAGRRMEYANCPWLKEARDNPVFCLVCRAMVLRSFTWTGLGGSAEQVNTIAAGGGTCRFDLRPGTVS